MPTETVGEVAQHMLCRDRIRLVLRTMCRILADREIDDRDIMMFVVSIRKQLADHPANSSQASGSS